MKIKTSELEGAALDWAVGQTMPEYMEGFSIHKELGLVGPYWAPSFSTRWEVGGPLIEKYKVGVSAGMNGKWCAVKGMPNYASTPLIAAMRAIVASELGDEVDVPEELL